MKEKKKKITRISILITSIFIILLSVTYAFINQTLMGTKRQVITAGDLSLILEEDNEIILENALPMYDEVGMLEKPFTFRLHNRSPKTLDYTLKLANITEEASPQLDTTIVKYGLKKDEENKIELLSALNDNILDNGSINGDQTINYELRLWIDSGVEDETTIKDKTLKYKIEVIGASAPELEVEFEGIEETKIYSIGKVYGTLPKPTKTGYIFNGWYNASGEQITETSIVKAEDTKLTAKWNKASYTVSIDPKEGTWNDSTTIQTINLEYEETREIANPTREGYTFQSWQVNGTGSKLENSTFTMGSEDATLTAVWKINNYTLTVKPEGGTFEGKTENQTYTIEYLKTKEIEDPIREGYTFIGWEIDGEGSSLNSNVFTIGANNATLTAKWKVNQYKWISYHYKQNVTGEGYTKVDASTGEGQADFGSQVTPPVLTFSGFTSPLTQTITIQVDSNPPVKNKVDYNYSRNKYSLTVNPNGGSYAASTENSEFMLYYEATKTIENPTRTGYTFTNWSISGGSIRDKVFTMSDGASTLTANWELAKYIVTLNPTGGSVSTGTTEVTYSSTYGNLPTPTRNGYKFLGWFTAESGGSKVESTTTVSRTENHTLYAQWQPLVVSDTLFLAENLGANCKTYNDGVDTFLVGQCQNNYVWYSGKLWRVVLKNNTTGAVKMITDNAMTSITYNTSKNTAFTNSYADQWLNQEFLPTLHDYENYLVTNSVWDTTKDSTYPPVRPNGTTTTTRAVGLLNYYEYCTAYNNSDGLATDSTVYLNNNTEWILGTPDSDTGIKAVYSSGSIINSSTSAVECGIRPTVNLKANIQIDAGTGSISNPYRIAGDSKETIGGTTLLSTRYIGEYIKFNNELYRIIDVENGKTKVNAVDVPNTLTNSKFHSQSEKVTFANATIKTDLETYYQGLDTKWKNMIETNQIWYLGEIPYQGSYKATICKTVDINTSSRNCGRVDTTTTASIGLSRVGEMFTSQITRGTKAQFWLLTSSGYSAYYLNNSNSLYTGFMTNEYGVRPSMYLKSNVVISSTNTGDGTYEHPYEIQ